MSRNSGRLRLKTSPVKKDIRMTTRSKSARPLWMTPYAFFSFKISTKKIKFLILPAFTYFYRTFKNGTSLKLSYFSQVG